MATEKTQSLPTPKFGFDPNYLEAFQDKLFIEGGQSPRRLFNFFALLLMATLIATYGLLSASTATVIGAMIVAPLMGPIMATTAAIVMGQSRRALRALALVLAGILCTIGFSYLLTLVVPDITISFSGNPELASRINPGLYALLTALGSGAAGAFITSRDELADSMGGVAIAISLVPPLCVVGIALQLGQWNAAIGALLLFTTNFLAILLAGGLTLWIIGVGKVAATKEQLQVRRRGFALFVIATLLVVIPLSITAYQTVTDVADDNRATNTTQQWLEGTQYQLVAVNVSDKLVVASVEGAGELKPVQSLAARLSSALGRPVIVRLRIVPSQSSSSGGSSE
jgi:uncharacterized hydrophobic protein (TIGR00271 family)